MSDRMVVELLAHMDAGDRTKWTADQDTRPLSELGRRQARRICDELAREPVDALYSSPALRCRQTIEPLAERFGLRIAPLDGLHETNGWLPPPGWTVHDDVAEAVGGAYSAGGGVEALEAIRKEIASGRVVACTHGDVLPAVIAFLVGAHRLDVPTPNRTRGGWYTVVLEANSVRVRHHDVLPGFPL
jgi:broad specificity phosphatase PhoE